MLGIALVVLAVELLYFEREVIEEEISYLDSSPIQRAPATDDERSGGSSRPDDFSKSITPSEVPRGKWPLASPWSLARGQRNDRWRT